MRDRVMVLFLRLRDQVLPRASHELETYLIDLGQFVRGHLDWTLSCERYTNLSDDSQAITRLPTTWKQRPADDSLQPVRVPSIAWWWEQLEKRG